MFERLETLAERLEEINRALMDPATASDAKKMRTLGQEHEHLSDVVDCWREY